jgi:hypothetical protein
MQRDAMGDEVDEHVAAVGVDACGVVALLIPGMDPVELSPDAARAFAKALIAAALFAEDVRRANRAGRN